jgi:hypothetical protein
MQRTCANREAFARGNDIHMIWPYLSLIHNLFDRHLSMAL